MLFNSIHFAIFFPIVVILYFAINYRFRWLLLLVASYYFYMAWEPEYAILMLWSTVVDYLAGFYIGRTDSHRAKAMWLGFSLVTNLGLLLVFKYYNFFTSSLQAVGTGLGIPLHISESHLLLPVGISFYTFQTLSYVIECYAGRQKSEENFGMFALYVSFFPQLVAGPIERPQNLLRQLKQRVVFEYPRVAQGIRLMGWGLFKKVVVADRLAPMVEYVYNDPKSFGGPSLSIATIFFAFQIYCDFSGYTDIAIGAAKILGVDLMENFRRPYHSRSISEFWRRWHISLSTWFRDYIYFPLGGMKESLFIRCRSLLIVFIISGLWHGANWTFVIWGALHGIYLVASLIFGTKFKGLRKKIYPPSHNARNAAIQIALTFLLVNLSWIFFRAKTVSDAFYIAGHVFDGWDIQGLKTVAHGFGLGGVKFTGAALAIFAVVGFDILEEKYSFWSGIASRPAWVRWTVYYFIILGCVLFGIYNQSAFIYFQF